MDPKTRYLVKVDENDLEGASKIIDTLMGDDASKRRE
jgi:DNA gyrase/topoisomerase IV subunit B